jgi:osmotically inducible protein OsmC
LFFDGAIGKEDHEPESIETKAVVHLEKEDAGFAITLIELTTHAVIPNITLDEFMVFAEGAKANCPVSQALAAVPIKLEATLANT